MVDSEHKDTFLNLLGDHLNQALFNKEKGWGARTLLWSSGSSCNGTSLKAKAVLVLQADGYSKASGCFLVLGQRELSG